jgi:hypothetical protein
MCRLIVFLSLVLLPLSSQAGVVDYFNGTVEFFNEMMDFKNSGIYQFFTHFFAEFVIWLSVGLIKSKIAAVSFAWDVAQEILISLNLSSMISQAWGYLDIKVVNLLTFFKIPEAINIVLSAHVTKFVLRLIGL